MPGCGRRAGRAGRRAVSPLATLIVAAFIVGGLAPTTALGAPSGLRAAVARVLNHAAHRARSSKVSIAQVRTAATWAYGDALLAPAKRSGEGVGIPTTFLAQRKGRTWHVALKGTRGFMAMLGKAPHRLVPHTIAKANRPSAESLASGLLGGAGGGGPSFSLPWATGQTWLLWQGPHNTNGAGGRKPWTSLDLAGGDGLVRAAADGIVYRPCANYVIVDHGGGWETG